MSRAEDFADQFLAANRELHDLVKDATSEQWRTLGINHPEIRRGEDEGRPVGVIVHHVATGYSRTAARCQAWMRGEDPDPPNDEINTRHAADNPDPDQQATLRLLQDQAQDVAKFIRGLSETELAAKGRFATGPITVEDFVGRILPFHIRWHLGSIQATWSAMENPPPAAAKT